MASLRASPPVPAMHAAGFQPGPPLPATRRRARHARVCAVARAPRRFARVHRPRGGAATLQTRVTRYRAASAAPPGLPTKLDLYAVVHYADRGYYAALNRALTRYDRVYFECITEPGNVSTAPATGLRTLRLPVGASRAAAAEARALALVPQMEAWDSALPNGFVADLTTVELAAMAARTQAQPPRARAARAARQALRVFCFLLPCPEVAALLADALPYAKGGEGGGAGGGGDGGVLPRAAAAALLALARGDLRSARKLVCARLLSSPPITFTRTNVHSATDSEQAFSCLVAFRTWSRRRPLLVRSRALLTRLRAPATSACWTRCGAAVGTTWP